MRNYEILESLCNKLKSWGINPITLLKAIGIFLIIIVLIIVFIKLPVLFGIVWIGVICIAIIALLYLMLE